MTTDRKSPGRNPEKTATPTRVFIHGLESSSMGAKGQFFRRRFPDMIIEDFQGAFSLRMAKLEALLTGKSPLILVGSSYGGLMAAVYACRHEKRVVKLILLAPALHLEPYETYQNTILHMPIEIFHGVNDTVVPIEAVRALAGRLYTNHRFHPMDDDHPLHATFETFDWETLLLDPSMSL